MAARADSTRHSLLRGEDSHFDAIMPFAERRCRAAYDSGCDLGCTVGSRCSGSVETRPHANIRVR
eukprot:12569781-Alexandrium_andersonii.AAC.1